MIDPLASTDYKGPGPFVATESIGFDPSPRECLKRQHCELGNTMQNGTCPGHHNAVAYGINPQNGSLMVPCTKEVGHENRVAIAYDGYNQTAHDECTFPLRTANESEGDDRTVKVAIRTANGVECLTPEQPMTHRVFSADGSSPTLFANSGGGQNQQSICVRTANGVECLCPEQPQSHRVFSADGAMPCLNAMEKSGADQSAICVKTANTKSNGDNVNQSGAAYTMDGANGCGVAIGIDPYNSCSTGEVSKTLNTAVAQDTDNTGAVAIGIGRDAFNSGKNAQMAQSFSTEVQPPITAKGPGGYAPMANNQRGGRDADS